MISRYTKTRAASSDDHLKTGTQELQVESYGTLDINVRGPDGKTEAIALTNVAYVSDFQTNLVSLDKVIDKGAHLDSYNMRLHDAGDTVCYIDKIDGLMVLEHATVEPSHSKGVGSSKAQGVDTTHDNSMQDPPTTAVLTAALTTNKPTESTTTVEPLYKHTLGTKDRMLISQFMLRSRGI
jgi:hypothetical protein